MAPVVAGRTLPTGRAGRMLALGIAAVLAAVLWLAIGSPLKGAYDDRARSLAARRAVVDHMAVLAAQLPALRRAAAGGDFHAGPSALIQASSDAIAGAALQEQVQQMASGLGATLSSSESLAPTQDGAYRRVGVRIAVTAPYDIMVRLLAAIEQASPTMLIDDLQLHGSRIQMLETAPLEGALTVLAFRQGVGADRSTTAEGGAPADDQNGGQGGSQGGGRGGEPGGSP